MNSGLLHPLNIGGREIENNLILAPIAGVSDLPFRSIVKSFGCGLVVSELISSEGLVRDSEKTRRYLSHGLNEKPISIQVFGHHPDPMARAAALAEREGADFIDINFGCPVPKVTRSGAGAGVMKDPDRARAIMEAMVKSVGIPVTMKMRIGMDEKTLYAVDLARMAEDSGIAAITVHGRTVSQGFSGKADWDWIRKVKEAVRIPVIGNGDIVSPRDGEKMLSETGCDGIMIGRGAFGNPWIFQEIRNYLENGTLIPDPPVEEIRNILSRHFNLMIDFYGERHGTVLMRKHACWYTRGLPGGSLFRTEINQVEKKASFLETVGRYFDMLGRERSIVGSAQDVRTDRVN